MWLEADDGLHVSGRPRCLRSINPTVTFILRCDSVIAESRFTVFFAGDRIVHKETTLLAPVIDVSVDGCLYSTLLVPEYWETISDSLDPTQFTIYQEIARIDNSTIVLSATYKFSYPQSRHSPIFPPAAIDTPCAPNTRPDQHPPFCCLSRPKSASRSGMESDSPIERRFLHNGAPQPIWRLLCFSTV
ncbi:hypothetical protein R3P38DRAFT_3075977, partial [Favolaschia claudopus]